MIYYDSDFIEKMKNRMQVSGAKYGPVTGAQDALACLRERLRLYERDGNTEWLVDVANYAMIEFMIPSHDNAHFNADTVSPGIIMKNGTRRFGGEHAS